MEPMPIDLERLKELRGKMLEHLEAALACSDEAQDGVAGYLIECAMDEVRQAQWPALDPRRDLDSGRR
jgi:hypothetical protein